MAFEVFNFGKRLGLVGPGAEAASQSGRGGPIAVSGKTVYEWPEGGCGWDEESVVTDIVRVESSPLDPGYTRYIMDCIPNQWAGGGGGVEGPVTYYNPPQDKEKPNVVFVDTATGIGECPENQKERIRKIFNEIFDSLDCIEKLGKSGEALARLIRSAMIYAIRVFCRTNLDPEPCPPNVPAYTSKPGANRPSHVVLCPAAFGLTDRQLFDILLHELVHYADPEASEVDAYILVALCGKESVSFGLANFNENNDALKCKWCSIVDNARGGVVVTDPPLKPAWKIIWGKWFSVNIESGDIYLISRNPPNQQSDVVDSNRNQVGTRVEVKDRCLGRKAFPPSDWLEKAKNDPEFCKGCRYD